MQEGVSLLREQLGSIEFLEERVHLFVLVGEVCLGYSRARYRRPGPGFDPAHPWFSIGIVWIGGTVVSTTPSTYWWSLQGLGSHLVFKWSVWDSTCPFTPQCWCLFIQYRIISNIDSYQSNTILHSWPTITTHIH